MAAHAHKGLTNDSHAPWSSRTPRSTPRRFTGSAGTAVVTRTEAHLFVDTRYWVQAAKETDLQVWTLEKLGQKGVKAWDDWVLGVSAVFLRTQSDHCPYS